MNTVFKDFIKKQKRRSERYIYRIENTFNSKLLMDQIFKCENEYDRFCIHFYKGYEKNHKLLTINFINPLFTIDYVFQYGIFEFRINNEGIITHLNRKNVNLCIDDLYDKGVILSLSMVVPNINLLHRYRDFVKNLVLLSSEIRLRINDLIDVNEYEEYSNLDIKDLRCTLSI